MTVCGGLGMTGRSDDSAVFLSVSERQKETLARPFRDLLYPTVEGYIMSDLPLTGGCVHAGGEGQRIPRAIAGGGRLCDS